MNNGWYRITGPRGNTIVLQVMNNSTSLGRVNGLLADGCLFEEVEVFTKDELERLKVSTLSSQDSQVRSIHECVQPIEEVDHL